MMKFLSMLCLFTGLAFAANAQQKMNNYEVEWKKVNKLWQSEGLPESALKEVQSIYIAAAKEGNSVQQIKALLYIGKLSHVNTEDAAEKQISFLEKNLQSSREPVKAMLHSMIATALWQYYQENRWNLEDRTQLANKGKDIATWTAADLLHETTLHFNASLQPKVYLQTQKISDYVPLIISSPEGVPSGEARGHPPGNTPYPTTLYDLLAHCALEFFEQSDPDYLPILRSAADGIAGMPRRYSDQSGASFQQDQKSFAPAVEFSAHRFESRDSSDLQFHALRIYQDLTAFHLKDKTPDARIDLEIKRFVFCRAMSELDNKDAMYSAALLALEEEYPTNPAAAQGSYLRVQLAYQLATREQETNDDPILPLTEQNQSGSRNRIGLKPIAAECRSISSRFPHSEGGLNAARLLQQIEKKSFSLTTEKVNSSGLPFRMLVQYKNISGIHYRIIRVTDDMLKVNNRDEEKFWSHIKEMPSLRTVAQPLPLTEDLRDHRVEVRVDALEPGQYALLASIDNSFALKENALALQYFYVSSIAYIQRGQDFFVLHRETGKPLAAAEAFVSSVVYDYASRDYKSIMKSRIQTDADGYFKLPDYSVDRSQIKLDIRHNNDRLAIWEGTYYYSYDSRDQEKLTREDFEKKHRRLSLFTDRGIYRPGQTLHFKGILVTRDYDTKRYKILTNHPSTITLHNTEGTEIDSLKLTTNAFGSFSGNFRIPETVMTGQFSIEDHENAGNADFSIEEYKRPSFRVDFETVRESVRLNDTIQLKGNVVAYSGSVRNGAEVRFRVTRGSRFPYPWFARNRYFPGSRPAEIANGKAIADENGVFTIAFKATPDKSIEAARRPVFDYLVSVDVTDQGGETRSAETHVHAGYHAVELSAQVEGQGRISSGKDAIVRIQSRNLNGRPVANPVELRVFPLQSPQRLIRPRLWPAPDTFAMSEMEFLKSFPYDEYRQESNSESWPKGKEICLISNSLKTGDDTITVPMAKLSPGWYQLEIRGRDIFGQDVMTKSMIRIEAEANGSGELPHYLSSTIRPALTQEMQHSSVSHYRFEPGSRVTERISTTAPELWLIRQWDRSGAIVRLPQDGKQSNPKKVVAMETPAHPYQVFAMQAGVRDLTMDITEDDRGGFSTDIITIKHNRIFTANNILEVPWTNKALDIRLTTFREKTEPGAVEKWTVQIAGPKREQTATEILTSMYDASLDQFTGFRWNLPDFHSKYADRSTYNRSSGWDGRNQFQSLSSRNRIYPDTAIPFIEKGRQNLLWQDGSFFGSDIRHKREMTLAMAAPPVEGRADSVFQSRDRDPAMAKKEDGNLSDVAAPAQPVVRTNFQETAFFFPDLHTDSVGNVSFSFTMPDALTAWKWQVLAHTRDLSVGMALQQIVTQKELMVQANAPRFLRESDQLVFPARITNMGEVELSGQAELQVLDSETGQVVDGLFNNLFPVQYFTAGAKQGTVVHFPLQIPGNYSRPVSYRIIARTKTHSDGEEQTLPVLSNRILVTETLPFFQREGSKTYTFAKLRESGQSQSLTHHALTVELSTNPAWYAIQSLPYLTGYPYDCSEQVFNRFYANAMAAGIAESNPEILKTFVQWQKDSTHKSLQSKLEKTPELKNILLQETPWALDAQKQSAQMREMAILFSESRIRRELDRALIQIEQLQSPNGGFVWFPGGPDNRYITQYIVAGMGKLLKTGYIPEDYRARITEITQKALRYMDARIEEDYAALKKNKADLTKHQIGNLQIQYLYAISFYPGREMKGSLSNALLYYHKQGQQFWLKQSRGLQAMLALALWRSKDGKTPPAILLSLKQSAVNNNALGMYWKRSASPWRWQEADVEGQSLAIEAFAEINRDEEAIAQMKQWLLTQKQTSHWASTRATADACYALIIRGGNWLSGESYASVNLGGVLKLDFKNDSGTEVGTGYKKSVIPGSEVTSEMGNFTVTLGNANGKTTNAPAWGAAYWQYFENLENLTDAGGPLLVNKKLFRSVQTEKGPILEDAAQLDGFKVGDKLVVRLEIRTDRDLEFVHLKDMRASGSEPVNVLSGYKYQGGLGYYESTRDVATNFFFERMQRGTYVFEYPLFISQEGRFSTGPAIIQCLYAPEFTAHSQGMRLHVKAK